MTGAAQTACGDHPTGERRTWESDPPLLRATPPSTTLPRSLGAPPGSLHGTKGTPAPADRERSLWGAWALALDGELGEAGGPTSSQEASPPEAQALLLLSL